MPKVKRNANLSRVARRRIATSDNLPSPDTRKTDNAKDGSVIQSKDHSTLSPSLGKARILLDNDAKANQKKSSDKNATDDGNNDGTDNRQTQQLSRGQRKRQAKREQFLKKEKMILSSLMLRRQEQQKKRIDGLDAIKEALMDTKDKNKNDQNPENDTIKPVQHIATNKAKRKLVGKEIEHVNLILQHPTFKKDPLETMQEHLRNSFAEDRKQQELLSKKRTEEEKRKMQKKRAEKDGIKKKSQKKKYKPRRTK